MELLRKLRRKKGQVVQAVVAVAGVVEGVAQGDEVLQQVPTVVVPTDEVVDVVVVEVDEVVVEVVVEAVVDRSGVWLRCCGAVPAVVLLLLL